MPESLRALVLKFFRVPQRPEPPPGEESALRVFRAGRNFYLYKLFGWAAGQAGALAGLVFALIFIRVGLEEFGRARQILMYLEILGWAGFLLQLPFTYAIVRLDFEMRWYMVSDRSLRIREGIYRVEEKTITFANIQNMVIRQGPLQRLLKISDLEVKTAGGGAAKAKGDHKGQMGMRDRHTAYFHGVDNAEEIREAIRKGLKSFRDSGLGDPDEVHEPAAAGDSPDSSVVAAREALAEFQALRQSLSSSR